MNNALIKVSNHFDSKFTDYQKDRMSKLSVIGNPSNNLILIDISKLNPGDNVDGLIYVDSINSDPVYNRILDVTVNNVIGRVENKNGFSYSDCGNIKVYVRPGGIIVTTQGNHRTLMKIGVDGNNSTIPAKIIVHKDGLTLQEMQKIEASDHHTDCNHRTNQLSGDKFKSGYVAEEPWAIELDKHAEMAGVSIGDTNPHRDSKVSNFGYFSKAINVNAELAVKITRRMSIYTDNINTTLVKAFTKFANWKDFSKLIEDIDKRNNVDSLDGYIDYLFTLAPADVIQKDIVTGSSSYKKDDLFIAKLGRLYNQYIKVNGFKHANNKKKCITDNAFRKFMSKNTQPMFVPIVNMEFTRFI